MNSVPDSPLFRSLLSEPEPSGADVLYIHGDQLNLSVFPRDVLGRQPTLLFVESLADDSRLPFHKKKLILQWSARRHFALDLSRQGYAVRYIQTAHTASEVVAAYARGLEHGTLTVMEPAEWDPRAAFRTLEQQEHVPVRLIKNNFFLAEENRWRHKIKKGYRMEFFYRDMRRETGYLMHGDTPVGGSWNYDEQNRKRLPKEVSVPAMPQFPADEITLEVIREIEHHFPGHYGNSEGFSHAVSRDQALQLLDHFVHARLPLFGPYQDAMAESEPFLFHSLLSAVMNLGLLLPAEVCERVLQADLEQVPLNSVEGFIRQVIGWREYMRVYYEAMMPSVREANFFEMRSPLPSLYWTGETPMKCLKESVQSVLDYGYAHHIQRLMVLGNFSNLTQTSPFELYQWFWYAFVDAHEWVVLPNVLGMSTYADGGVLASKPYVSGGNYIQKMSDYCRDCYYNVREKEGERACPFNHLYWNFIDSAAETISQNPRSSFMVKTWNRKDPADQQAIRDRSAEFIEGLKRYEPFIADTPTTQADD